jgi:geranylgeranyl diphosphate synthase type I
MKEILKYRDELSKEISIYLDSKSKDFSNVNILGKDVLSKLKEYTLNGKLIRGCLIIASTEIFSKNNNLRDSKKLIEESKKAAIAIELFQSSVLMHDDIFDRDDMRRGKPAIHYQFEMQAKANRFEDPKHYGMSMATCTGDIGFFMCNELLSSLDIDSFAKKRIIDLVSREVQYVALAEMHDIHLENVENYTLTDIINIYKYKTARYTFSMPLAIGAIISNETEKNVETLIKIGENLGVIFQIKDDELGIYGNISELGKSVGIDIRDNKKTIYHYMLFNLKDKTKIQKLKSIFGKKNLSIKDVEAVRKIISETGIKKKIDETVNNYILETEKLIKNLNLGKNNETSKLLKDILIFNLERNK